MLSRFSKKALALGLGSFAVGLSIKTVFELTLGDRLSAIDQQILRNVATLRSGWLNGSAVDLTALGSGTLLALATAVIAVLLLSTRDIYGMVHLLCAAAGAGVLTTVFKRYFARPRPDVVDHLVHVSQTGFSYPSGHALGTAACYFSFALIARRHLPRHISREILIGFSLAMIVIIGASRVYLGVHYTSDVVAGMLIGVGWSLVLAAAFSWVEREAQRRSLASIVALD